MKLTPAKIHFNAAGTPVAEAFDDVYFSTGNGLAESKYVFQLGNQLDKKFAECNTKHFVIAETGFGTGLNCLAAIDTFSRFRRADPSHPLEHLHLLSCEKYPLSQADLQQALTHFPELAVHCETLVLQYPMALSGAHRIHFENATLDLWFDDVHNAMAQWASPSQGLVDAWFLDGFAPSKNPDMWTQSLFEKMANLSRANATVATFTAAGFVRRGLIDAGFSMQKKQGFGRKRDMLVGCYQPEPGNSNKPDDVNLGVSSSTGQFGHIAIIGAGLAGANLAYALAKRGYEVSVFSHGSIACGASGNAQGGFYPQLHAQVTPASQLQAHCFLYAKRLYEQLADSGFAFSHDWCGVLQLAYSEQSLSRQAKIVNNTHWPTELVHALSAGETSEKAGLALPYASLCYSQGGWISPVELVEALLRAAAATSRVELFENALVTDIHATDKAIEISSGNQRYLADHLVLATGHHSHLLNKLTQLPLRAVRGQVEYIPTQSALTKLKTVLCHKGYLTPAHNDRHALGSTYVRQDSNTEYRQGEENANLTTLQTALANAQWAQSVVADQTGRASIRAALPDRQPALGCLAPDKTNRVSVFNGLGSRGVTTAPLLAELLASQLTGQPLPLAKELIATLSPCRFET